MMPIRDNSAATKRAAAERQVVRCEELVAVLTEQLHATVLGSAARHELRTRLGHAEQDLADAREHSAAVNAGIAAGAEQAVFAQRCAEHAAALADTDLLAGHAQQLDAAYARLIGAIGTFEANAQRVAHRAGLRVLAHALTQPVPDARHLVDSILGRMVVAGLLAPDDMPARYSPGLTVRFDGGGASVIPSEQLVAADTTVAMVAALREAIVANPPLSPADIARRDAEAVAKRAAEAARLRQPMPPQTPAPPPVAFVVAP
jgi:hypothetical protein